MRPRTSGTGRDARDGSVPPSGVVAPLLIASTVVVITPRRVDSTEAVDVERVERVGTATDRGLRLAILGVIVVGLRERKPGAVANGVVGLCATFLPDALARWYDLTLSPRYRIWVSGSMFLHAVGMLGPYDDTWWWDHVTHTLSSSLIGAVAHVYARRHDRDPTWPVLGAVVGFGLFWEGIEYLVRVLADRLGIRPVLVQYGRADTIGDLVFDVVGGLIVVAFGGRLLDGLFDGEEP